ncbi:feruloyl-CoA synthase [Pseudooceanicola batsensis HTCC2597]|uniref:Feruloyl-CoA synthase n=1 Tax=Pseudooceanicola batsensis (strain ATCC BAA-863 / DSM 15984 / KCTC 12145 / HTCC2597) TaxID=252305 RepID=A3TUR5_PSEBH|nr:feruloyl-CoA synthase [Pseudooceanicola batsensis]EAQ04261.1 feruloyl-CoA synthase [Pseudooceanicola batsensis HTCC2597]
MANAPGYRQAKLWNPALRWEERPDGTWLIWRDDPIAPYPDRMTDLIDHWAEKTPEAVWMADRDGDDWRRVTYGDLAATVRRVGQWLLDRNLSVERPLMILSENTLEHAMIALSAQYVGIPSAAISPAYSLVASDFAKLRGIAAQITPGAVFAQQAAPFEDAILTALPEDVLVITAEGRVTGRETALWSGIDTEPTDAVSAAHAATGPESVVKFLFTSGTTGTPKAVIQTNRMLTSNQEIVADCYAFLREEPPVVVNWLPWSHTAAGNKVFNMVLYNGGTYYIDHGKPTPGGMAETIRNLREISPNWHLTVPAGFEALARAMETDDALRESFFRDLKHMMYAGAGLAQHTWTRLEELAEQTVGHRVLMSTGLGSTETAPFSLYCTDPQPGPGNVGIPSQGVIMKLVPVEDKLEVRIKGPNVTPGYWRNPEMTAEAFDQEGFYMLGDALRFAEPGNPARGFFFDGRIAENFKLQTGTWVAVGALRAKLVDQMGGLASDAVIVGENRDRLTALLVPDMARLARIAAPGTPATGVTRDPAVRAAVAGKLADHGRTAGGSSGRITAAMLMDRPLDLDKGEVTDKGSVNQRAVLRHRADLVERLYAEDDPDVILPKREVSA